MIHDMQIDRLRDYLQRLTLQERTHLLAELERLQQYGEGPDGSDVVLAELRAELKSDGPHDVREDPAARFFFAPLEPVVFDGPPEKAGCGRISRGSLPTIWEWMTGSVLRAMANDYATRVRHLAAANKAEQAEAFAIPFQDKAAKMLDDMLASPDGAAQVRAALATFTSTPVFDDLVGMLQVLHARHALAQLQKALPARIGRLEGRTLARIRAMLDTVQSRHPEAVPFALTMVARRLRTPWQLIRLATKIAPSKEAADVAATPYAVAVAIALDEIVQKRQSLRRALRSNRVLVARDLLVDIYDIEYALRVRIDHLDGSPWGRQLDALIASVDAVVATEVHSIPSNLHHVLDSRRLHRHDTPKGRLVYLGWKIHDALFAVAHVFARLTPRGLHP